MKPQHILLALLVAAIWGINFTVISVGLGSFPPLLLAALRFAIAATPALLLPRPNIRWPLFIWIGATLFLGQFALLFTGMAVGITAGLASVVLQSQAFLTILIASTFLRERPTFRQITGTLVAFAGLVVIADTAGGTDFTMTGLGLCLAAALCWAVGNVLLRRAGTAVDMFALMAWLSLIPPIPLLGMSLIVDGPATLGHAMQAMSWGGVGTVLYIAVLSTTLCFAIWGQLLKKYPASAVAPFSLLVPIFGAASAALFLGEKFETTRIVGMIMVTTGLVVIVIPTKRFWRPQRT
ncbi:EamA family transporter [Agrobacterium vitis]|uniref:EamA family transporter n=1 Tax=Agrobacterium vitis TaxID=373 RepID=A0A368P0B8_AGRVI|nr:EamA family transporter [Agrobacterium vitis]KAA3507588.1 EamA family transporter [Agrobacterium vitis]KAA3521847.1 EamA family transporter [Agrobacterium vitis]MCF1480017.1 EamA family transporter [Agrobacterium vitis]MUZ98389.1 EamA family transporter [Agrobacterium vitis]MVA31084.1 EamA family transporter [Agrobacterium vitis]